MRYAQMLLLVVGITLATLRCTEKETCRPSDLSCSPLLALPLYGCLPARWSSFYGVSGVNDLQRGLLETRDGGFLAGSRATASFGNPVRAFSGPDDPGLIKLDRLGRREWTTFLGTAGDDVVDANNIGLLETADGYLVIAHAVGDVPAPLRGQAYFGTGTNRQVLIAKLDRAGALLYTSFFGGATSNTDAGGVVVPPGGGFIISGTVDGALGGTAGAARNAAPGGQDLFVARFADDLTPLWHAYLGSTATEVSIFPGPALAPDGDIWIAGSGNTTLAPGFPNETGAPVGGGDILVGRFSADGFYRRHAFIGSSVSDAAIDVRATSDDGLIISGQSAGVIGAPTRAHSSPGGSNQDMLVLRTDSVGQVQWSVYMGGAVNTGELGTTIQFAPDGALYVAGATENFGTPRRPYNGGSLDVALARIDPVGGYLLEHSFYGGPGTDGALLARRTCDGGFAFGVTADAGFGAQAEPFSESGGLSDSAILRIGPER